MFSKELVTRLRLALGVKNLSGLDSKKQLKETVEVAEDEDNG